MEGLYVPGVGGPAEGAEVDPCEGPEEEVPPTAGWRPVVALVGEAAAKGGDSTQYGVTSEGVKIPTGLEAKWHLTELGAGKELGPDSEL